MAVPRGAWLPALLAWGLLPGRGEEAASTGARVAVGIESSPDVPRIPPAALREWRSHRSHLADLTEAQLLAAGYRQTPNGWWPKECIFQVPSGTIIEMLKDKLGIRHTFPDGTQHIHDRCTRSHLTTNSLRSKRSPPASVSSGKVGDCQRDDQSHSQPIISFGTRTSPSLRHFSATYTVPAYPNTVGDQWIYWWLGVEPGAMNMVLQPVLGYHGGSWQFQSWNFCDESGLTTIATAITNIPPGAKLQGLIQQTGSGPDSYAVRAQYHQQSSSLVVNDGVAMVIPVLNLETYGIGEGCVGETCAAAACDLLPTSPLTLTDISVVPATTFQPWEAFCWSIQQMCNWKVELTQTSIVATPPAGTEVNTLTTTYAPRCSDQPLTGWSCSVGGEPVPCTCQNLKSYCNSYVYGSDLSQKCQKTCGTCFI